MTRPLDGGGERALVEPVLRPLIGGHTIDDFARGLGLAVVDIAHHG
jgi:hypothetical protein